MIRVYSIVGQPWKPVFVERYPSLADAVRDVREMWKEVGDLTLFFDELTSTILASSLRLAHDSELCLTVYNDGHSELHRCSYLKGAERFVDQCEVTEILSHRTAAYQHEDGKTAVVVDGVPWTLEEIMAREG